MCKPNIRHSWRLSPFPVPCPLSSLPSPTFFQMHVVQYAGKMWRVQSHDTKNQNHRKMVRCVSIAKPASDKLHFLTRKWSFRVTSKQARNSSYYAANNHNEVGVEVAVTQQAVHSPFPLLLLDRLVNDWCLCGSPNMMESNNTMKMDGSGREEGTEKRSSWRQQRPKYHMT